MSMIMGLSLFIMSLIVSSVSAQQYVTQSYYTGSSCSSTSVFFYNIAELGTCIKNSSGDGKSFKYTETGTTSISLTQYNDLNCLSVNNSGIASTLNTCEEYAESGSISYSSAATLSSSLPPMQQFGQVGVSSFYGGTCASPTSSQPLLINIYPSSCVGYGSNFYTSYSCDANHIYESAFSSATCDSSSQLSFTPIFNIGCSNGLVYSCNGITPPYTTGSTATTGPVTTTSMTSSSTTGSPPTGQYVEVVTFFDGSCTGTPVAYSYVELGQCINQQGSGSYKYSLSGSSITYTYYGSSGCTSDVTSTNTTSLGVCTYMGFSESTLYSLSTSFVPPGLTGNIGTVSLYSSCSDTSSPLQRTYYSPTCSDLSSLVNTPYSLVFSCNSSAVSQTYYMGSSTCTLSAGVTEGQSELGVVGCNAGTAYECIHLGTSSTTSASTATASTASTSSASTTAASSTTGSSPNGQYVEVLTFFDGSCTGTPIAYSYSILGQCINEGSGSSKFSLLGSSVVYTYYGSSDCTSDVTTTNTTSLGVCTYLGSSESAFYSLSTSFVPSGLSGNIGTVSLYSSCSDTSSPLQRTYYSPTCADLSPLINSPYSWIFSCNSSAVSQTYYIGSSTCTNSAGVTEGQSELGAVGCNAGMAYDCVHFGTSSTTSSSTATSATSSASTSSISTTTAASSTTGSSPTGQYVEVLTYFDGSCTGTPAAYSYSVLGQCINQEGSGSSKYSLVGSSIIYTYYGSSDCTSDVIVTNTTSLGVCTYIGFSESTFYSLSTSFVPSGLSGNIGAISLYPSCSDTSSPLQRTYYSPACSDLSSLINSPYSLVFSCNSSAVSQTYYMGSSTCTLSAGVTEGESELGAVGCNDGTAYECIHLGIPSTSSSATTSSTTSASTTSSSTTGSLPNGQYVEIVSYATPNCSGTPLGYSFAELNKCVNEEGYSSRYIQVGQSVVYTSYSSDNCENDDVINTNSTSLGACTYVGFSQSTFYSLSSTFSPPSSLSGYVPVASQYDSCSSPSPSPSTRTYYNPSCVDLSLLIHSPVSILYECNSTSVFQVLFSGSSTCMNSSGVLISSYEVGPVGCDETTGYTYDCLYLGGSSTTSASTTLSSTSTTGLPSTTSGSSSTTGASPSGNYVELIEYLSSTCAAPLIGWEFNELNTCINDVANGVSSMYTQSGPNTVVYTTYSSLNCIHPTSSNSTSLNTCNSQYENVGIYYTLSSTFTPPNLSGTIVSVSTYQSCSSTSSPLSRIIYAPSCIDLSSESYTSSLIITCNATHVTETSFSGSATCTGGEGVYEYSYVMGVVGCNATTGVAYECSVEEVGGNPTSFTGVAPTTSSVSTTSSTSSASTTGSAPSGNYVELVDYYSPTCSSSVIGWAFSQINTCLNDVEYGSSSMYTQTAHNPNAITYTTYGSLNCINPTTSNSSLLNTCNSQYGTIGQYYTLTDSVTPPSLSGFIPTYSAYQSCSSTSSPLSRVYYSPTCVNISSGSYPLSLIYQCNATYVTVTSFSGSATCTEGEAVYTYASVIGPVGCNATTGEAYECIHM